MSSAPIDHVVITVADLDWAAAQFEALGFTLTPRALHPWGTANRLVQLAGGNFIELLEVDRPALLFEHDSRRAPPVFSFGAFNRDFLAAGCEGFSMLALRSDSSAADVARFSAAGLITYAPFDFARRAPLPDGRELEVAFSLAFASAPGVARAGFFCCHNKFPHNFWKPEFTRHRNGATQIRQAVLVAADPPALTDFLTGYTGSAPRRVDGGLVVACGAQSLLAITPEAFAARFDGARIDLSYGPRLGGLVIAAPPAPAPIRPVAVAAGVAIAWVDAT